MTQLVDWDLAVKTARVLSKLGPATSVADAGAAVSDLRAHATEAIGLVAEFTGLTGATNPPVHVVDRTGWCQANVAGMRELLDPLSGKLSRDPSWLARNVGSRVAGTQAGAVLGYLSGRVLGQFEVFGAHYGRLLLVAPNIIEAERELRLQPNEFRMWVCLHEAAHAAQFGGVPWLRGHFLDEINRFVSVGEPEETTAETVARFAQQTRRTVELFADSVRDSGSHTILDLLTSPQQRAVVDRLTAIMTLLEGHADYVMDHVGERVIGDVAAIRHRFDRRRNAAGPLHRVTKRLLGMDVKLAQYERGSGFVEAVVGAAGSDTFARVWEGPANLPTMEEIEDPDRWIARIRG
ncbi:zinc-dependent metalloprotease [Stackebrandtia soli]|uniref:zinc-dependent metalloprotease n=1 Tax=Stackebrandtia soli TaxID=1892856 RepID=UPI0039EA5598